MVLVQDATALGWCAAASGGAGTGANLKASAARIAARRAGGGVAIEWQLGNMPRIPKTWEEWGAPAYASARERHDTRHWEEMRLERERKAAEEVAARAAELSGLRRARDDATRQAAAAEAATASAKASSAAHLVKMQVAYDTRIAAIEARLSLMQNLRHVVGLEMVVVMRRPASSVWTPLAASRCSRAVTTASAKGVQMKLCALAGVAARSAAAQLRSPRKYSSSCKFQITSSGLCQVECSLRLTCAQATTGRQRSGMTCSTPRSLRLLRFCHGL